MKDLRDELIERLRILDDLTIWSSTTLIQLRLEEDLKAAESLDLIIAAMENHQIIEELKNIRDECRITF